MRTIEYAAQIADELRRAVERIPEAEADALAAFILRAPNVFTAGSGRTGLMGRAFAMRLMQMGLRVHVVGETVTPGMQPGDLLIIGSGSGQTKSLVVMAQTAKSLRASLAAATINPDSPIAKSADLVIQLPGSPKDQATGRDQTLQPMGALFEQTLLLFYDAVILRLMHQKGTTSETMFTKHANLE